jgi:hypothetical protein
MQPNISKHVFWSYNYKFNKQKDFPDPRIVIARQIGWKKNSTDFAEYTIPEPENYNRAIFMPTPTECPIVEDQVVYYDEHKQGWITVMYVPVEQIVEVDRWITTTYPSAQWRHTKPPRVKLQRGMLWTRDNKSNNTLTDNERLYTMGYFDDLKVKYFNDDTTYVDSLLGESRDSLKNFVPEEQSDEVEDF